MTTEAALCGEQTKQKNVKQIMERIMLYFKIFWQQVKASQQTSNRLKVKYVSAIRGSSEVGRTQSCHQRPRFFSCLCTVIRVLPLSQGWQQNISNSPRCYILIQPHSEVK